MLITAAVIVGKSELTGAWLVKIIDDGYHDHPITVNKTTYPLIPKTFEPSGKSYAFVNIPAREPDGTLPELHEGDVILSRHGRSWPFMRDITGLLIDENSQIIHTDLKNGAVDEEAVIKVVSDHLAELEASNPNQRPSLLSKRDFPFGFYVDIRSNDTEEALVLVVNEGGECYSYGIEIKGEFLHYYSTYPHDVGQLTRTPTDLETGLWHFKGKPEVILSPDGQVEDYSLKGTFEKTNAQEASETFNVSKERIVREVESFLYMTFEDKTLLESTLLKCGGESPKPETLG